jgi:hypothetical protein
VAGTILPVTRESRSANPLSVPSRPRRPPAEGGGRARKCDIGPFREHQNPSRPQRAPMQCVLCRRRCGRLVSRGVFLRSLGRLQPIDHWRAPRTGVAPNAWHSARAVETAGYSPLIGEATDRTKESRIGASGPGLRQDAAGIVIRGAGFSCATPAAEGQAAVSRCNAPGAARCWTRDKLQVVAAALELQ